jgi:hypothetical protein
MQRDVCACVVAWLRAASAASAMTSVMCAPWSLEETLLDRWSQDLEDMALRSGRSANHRMSWCASDTSPGLGTWPPPIKPTAAMVWWGARHDRVVTTAVRPLVRPATRWRRVVARAAARRSAGRRVARRRASLDCPAPSGPRSQRVVPSSLERRSRRNDSWRGNAALLASTRTAAIGLASVGS